MSLHIVSNRTGKCQSCPGDNESRAEFVVPSIIPNLLADKFVLLPGLTKWFHDLNPLKHIEAWHALGHKNINEIIHAHPQQHPRFFLNDAGVLDDIPQPSVEFKEKSEKSHLTLVEGSEAIAACPLLPNAVQSYLELCNEFISAMRDVFSEILPMPSLPAILKMRIFEYHASDPLAGMKPMPMKAMKPHVDGSICTLIIAQSDGLLRYEHRGQWHSAVRADGKAFALIIPGIAAKHDCGIKPTPHMVLASGEHRISVTMFFTPALSGDRKTAEQQIARWNLSRRTLVEKSFSA